MKWNGGNNEMINEGLFTSDSYEWGTPQALFDELNEEFNFSLDPCATKENAKCDDYYTESENGLRQSWGIRTVFCNPPYGRDIGKWVYKASREAKKGSIVVMLIPARTDTRWFHDHIYGKVREIRFLKGRLKFVKFGENMENKRENTAPFPSMVVIF